MSCRELRGLLGNKKLGDFAASWEAPSTRRGAKSMSSIAITGPSSLEEATATVVSPASPSVSKVQDHSIDTSSEATRPNPNSSELSTPSPEYLEATAGASPPLTDDRSGDATEDEDRTPISKRKRDSIIDHINHIDQRVEARPDISTKEPTPKRRKTTVTSRSSHYFKSPDQNSQKRSIKLNLPTIKRKSSDRLGEAAAQLSSPVSPRAKTVPRARKIPKTAQVDLNSAPAASLTLEQRVQQFNIDPSVLGAVTDPTILRHAAQYQHLSQQRAEDKMEAVAPPQARSLSADAIADFTGDFRARQRAIYTNRPFMRGAMFTGHGLDRDFIGTGVLLSRAGGGMTKDEEGNAAYAKSDTADLQMECAAMNKKLKQAVLILLGRYAEHFQIKFPTGANCVVLGWFMPTHFWHEKNGNELIARFRFENPWEKHAWFRPRRNEAGDNLEPAELGDYPQPSATECDSCYTTSQLTYVQGWCCLNHECDRFWRLSNGEELDSKTIAYHPHWLKQKTDFGHALPPYDFRLQPEITSEDFAKQVSAPSAAAHAIRCPHCGYVEARTAWTHWICPVESCGFRVNFELPFLRASDLCSWEHPIGDGPPNQQLNLSPAGQALGLFDVMTSDFIEGHRVTIVPLDGRGDGPRNFFCHMQANAAVNREPVFGPDALYEQLYPGGFLDEIKRPLSSNQKVVGPSYAGQYLQNYGEHYEYYTKQSTKPFATAPEVVNLARSRMGWAAQLLRKLLVERYVESNVPQPVDFNECLALGYKGEHQMGWHDDGEDSVYGIVGTMALGGEAEFSIRVHKQRFAGLADNGLISSHEPIKGCSSATWRMQHWPDHKARLNAVKGTIAVKTVRQEIGKELKAHRVAARNAYDEKVKLLEAGKKQLKETKEPELRKQIADMTRQLKEEKPEADHKQPPALITFTMRHGDMIWMFGDDMQSWYEHGVFRRFDRYNFPRFALTFRHILEVQKSGKPNAYFQGEPADPGFYPGPKLE